MNGWFDSPIESFKQMYQDAVDKWNAALEALDAAHTEFVANYEYASGDPDLFGQWSSIDNKVGILQGTIDTVKSAMSSVGSFFSSVGSAVGLTPQATMNGLGFLPAVPWALVGVIAASSAGVWAIVNEIRGFNVDVTNKRIAEQNLLRAEQGLEPLPYVTSAGSGGLFAGAFDGLSSTAKWIALGIGAYVVLQMVQSRKRLA